MKEKLKKILGPAWPYLRALYRAWMKFAHVLGVVNTTILLTLFYFLFLGVARLITLAGRKDLLDTRWKDRESYWKKREKYETTREAFLKPY